MGEPAEEKRENDHPEERLDHRPRHAKGRLAIAHLDFAPREEIKQLAVTPELGNGLVGHPTFWKSEHCLAAVEGFGVAAGSIAFHPAQPHEGKKCVLPKPAFGMLR